ncbi:recombinase zinc beta ribbon domain-containing protein [Microbacterium sp. MPKO10]|uniref:recombinase zinc beta ribbon domain-containing protein n=1 Tax=Microbacterium sp. MPKO10 TaxID=2989818 RepID=UPI0022359CC0|nr:recombinase zinc beta ribbon domain-containing protein [Microbacterium sp. MPKO10]MCW4457349.1 recombinase zinc beta ribbon domain-containing protein [Microbacterium sp. MPKO10]
MLIPKGSLFCGACGSCLQLDLPKNKQGAQYAYFVCTGRRRRTTGCTRCPILVAVAERLVADCYSRISETQYIDIDEEHATLR